MLWYLFVHSFIVCFYCDLSNRANLVRFFLKKIILLFINRLDYLTISQQITVRNNDKITVELLW